MRKLIITVGFLFMAGATIWAVSELKNKCYENDTANREFVRTNGGKVVIIDEIYFPGKDRHWTFKIQGVTDGQIIYVRGPREKDDNSPKVYERWLISYEGGFKFDRQVE